MTLKLAVIGAGIKARQYIDAWTGRPDVDIVAVADPSDAARNEAAAIVAAHGIRPPERFPQWRTMLASDALELDAVYVSTPHACHCEQAVAALGAGLDVLLEKPMVMTADEARQVIAAERSSGKVLVVAYQGGLSPLVQEVGRDVREKTYGDLVSINAAIWEDWSSRYLGHWKQQPAISGGGFMFDTGAHLLNTVSLIGGAEVERLSAFVDNRGYPVDSATAVAGRLRDGTVFSLNAAGDTIRVCESRIELFFTEAIVRLCAWGRWREVERPGQEIDRREQESANNLIDVFERVRCGETPNPSSAEQGRKLAVLWDAIRHSAESGQVVLTPHLAAS